MNQVFSCFHKYLLIILFPITIAGQAQTRLSDIDTSRIPQKTIRKFLKDQGKLGIVSFEDFCPSVDETTDASRFDFNCHHFHLRQAPATAWHTFLTAEPTQIWQGQIVSCGFIYSPVSQRVIFPSDNYPGLEPGQIFFIEMRILFGLVKFLVCFVVTKVDPVQRTITFSYVSSGPSKGAQTIRLIDDGKGEGSPPPPARLPRKPHNSGTKKIIWRLRPRRTSAKNWSLAFRRERPGNRLQLEWIACG